MEMGHFGFNLGALVFEVHVLVFDCGDEGHYVLVADLEIEVEVLGALLLTAGGILIGGGCTHGGGVGAVGVGMGGYFLGSLSGVGFGGGSSVSGAFGVFCHSIFKTILFSFTTKFITIND